MDKQSKNKINLQGPPFKDSQKSQFKIFSQFPSSPQAPRRIFQRKTDHKNTSRQKSLDRSISGNISPKYLPNSSINRNANRDRTSQASNSPRKLDLHDIILGKINIGNKETKTSSKEPYTNQKDEYYKYWQQKAQEYQEVNFNLHRLNSALQQENQVLKYQLEKLEKKIQKKSATQVNPRESGSKHNIEKTERIEKYYLQKLQNLQKQLEEKTLLVAKQDKKIKELSKSLEQNYKMKSLLDNMEERMSEVGSFKDKNYSNDKYSERSKTRGSEELRKIYFKDYLQIGSRKQFKNSSLTERKLLPIRTNIAQF